MQHDFWLRRKLCGEEIDVEDNSVALISLLSPMFSLHLLWRLKQELDFSKFFFLHLATSENIGSSPKNCI